MAQRAVASAGVASTLDATAFVALLLRATRSSPWADVTVRVVTPDDMPSLRAVAADAFRDAYLCTRGASDTAAGRNAEDTHAAA